MGRYIYRFSFTDDQVSIVVDEYADAGSRMKGPFTLSKTLHCP